MQKQSKALSVLGQSHDVLYTLEGLADGFAVNKGMGFHALKYSVKATCEKGIAIFKAASVNKDAAAYLAKGSATFRSMMDLVDHMDQSHDADLVNPGKTFRLVVTKALKAFVGEAGRYMERAEMALGETGAQCGYLGGMNIEGGDDMSLPRYNEAGEAYAALSPEKQKVALVFMKSLAKR